MNAFISTTRAQRREGEENGREKGSREEGKKGRREEKMRKGEEQLLLWPIYLKTQWPAVQY